MSKLLCFCVLLAACLLLPAPMLRAQSITVVVPPVPNPLYLKWFQDYEAQTGNHIFSETIGSGRGIMNGPEPGPIDFGIAEVHMNNDELRGQVGILNLPIVAHAVAIVYNLPGLTEPLRLTGPIIADIYLGRITRWNDPQIVRLNPGATLPDLAITPVHQSNGSGTTYVFTVYLGAISSDWKNGVAQANRYIGRLAWVRSGMQAWPEPFRQHPAALGIWNSATPRRFLSPPFRTPTGSSSFRA